MDSQLALSLVPDLQSEEEEYKPMERFEVPMMPSQMVTPSLVSEGKTKKSKMGTTIKWPPFLSTFVLDKMCGFIPSGVRTDKGFKEVHLNTVAKLVFVLRVGGDPYLDLQPSEEVESEVDQGVKVEELSGAH